MAKYYEFTEHDVVATVLTDSFDMYGSRLEELRERDGAYDDKTAAVDYARHMGGLKTTACWSSPIPCANGFTILNTTPGWSSRARPLRN
jgi:hypothetical protein